MSRNDVRTHRSACLVEPGRVEIREIPIPRPKAGQVLLRIDCALAGGTDRKAFVRGHPQIPMPGPFGHRYAGTVAELGSGAPPFEVGQPVMGVHSAPCLDCSLCRKNRQHLCPHVMREKVLGAFGQYLCIPAPVAKQNLFARPVTVSPEQAALLEPLACVVHGLEQIDWRGVDRVLVLGLGVMGLLFLRLLPSYVQAEIVAAGRNSRRVDLARQLKPYQVIELPKSATDGTWSEQEQFDVVIECTGKLDGWHEAFNRTMPGGQVQFFGGLPRDVSFPADSFRVHYEEVRILGSFHFSPADVAKAREHLLNDGFSSPSLISERVSLDRLSEALNRLNVGDGLQYAIDPWS